MAIEGKDYNPGFDLIRIISMAAVILIHLTTYLPIPAGLKFLFTWGSAGVPFFFVLSGFLTARTFVFGGALLPIIRNGHCGFYRPITARSWQPRYSVSL